MMRAMGRPDAANDPHVELFFSLTTRESIRVWCDCAIGTLHTYDEWVNRFQRPRSRLRAPAAVTTSEAP